MPLTDGEKENLFLDFAADYDRMINWEQRLSREAPFFERLFDEVGADRVLDTACGTGRHAILFCRRGLKVEAADPSPEMVERARQNASAAGCEIGFHVAPLEEIEKFVRPGFDVITCMGNSLPHIKTREGLEKAFRGISGLLNHAGVFALQIRNYRRVYDRNERFMPLNSRVDGGREYLYLRMTEPGDEFITFNIIVLVKDEKGEWTYRVETERLKPWMFEDINEAMLKTGLEVSGAYGDLKFGAFDSADSSDLVITARKTK